MTNPVRGDVITLLRQVDGKGVIGKQYLVLGSDGTSITIMFPGTHRESGEEDGWMLGSGKRQYVTDLGLDPDERSGWNLFPSSTYEIHHTPSDAREWVRVNILGEMPTEFAVGGWVDHRDMVKPVRLVYHNEELGRWMVHVPTGSHRRRDKGWVLDGNNTTAAQRVAVNAVLSPLGIDLSADGQDGFWWVTPDACTLIPAPDGEAGVVDVTGATERSKFEVITMHPSWDVCTRSHHPEAHREQREHVVVADDLGVIYYIEPYGSSLRMTNVPQVVKDRMREMGINPNYVNVYNTTRDGVESRRTLSVDEAREMWPIFRGPIADDAHGPWGWGTFTTAVRLDGKVQWMPCLYTSHVEIRVLSRDNPSGAGRRIESYSGEMDYVRRWGVSDQDTLYTHRVPSEDVLWFLPYMDTSLVSDVLFPPEDGPRGEALVALARLEARRANFIDVLTRGAERLGIQDELPQFLTDVGLSGVSAREYTISVPVEVTGTIIMRQTVTATSQAQAMQLLRTPRRGEQSVYIPRDDRIRAVGIPTITTA